LGFSNYIKISKDLYPTITLGSQNARVLTNFGQKKLKFFTKNATVPLNWSLNEDLFGRMYFEQGEIKIFNDPRFEKNWKSFSVENEKMVKSFSKVMIVQGSKNKKMKKWKSIQSFKLLNALCKIPNFAFVPSEYHEKMLKGISIKNDEIFIPSTRLIAKCFEELHIRDDMKFLSIGPSGSGNLIKSHEKVGFLRWLLF
jgi:hypothetical protein